jgi:hypothetical protein
VRFSGHETFSIREGWLYKGLKLLFEEPDVFKKKTLADDLGVGTNMARSIRHWLLATGLADIKDKTLQASNFGKIIYEEDPFFINEGTWWFLHINLTTKPIYADSWFWFFNHFNQISFIKSTAIENLRHYIQLNSQREPSIKTLERDVSCLLNSYSKNISSEQNDPEDSRECPFIELDLVHYYKSSNQYQINRKEKEIHPCVFGYSASKSFDDLGLGDITMQRLIGVPGSPGRVFQLTSETLFETVLSITNQYNGIQIKGHAGQRAISFPNMDFIDWVLEYYASIERSSKQ